MPSPDPTTLPPRPPSVRRWMAPIAILDALGDLLDHAAGRVLGRIANGTWEVLHLFGAHRWREGWETNAERGWRQFRGSRCTICDAPWEGW